MRIPLLSGSTVIESRETSKTYPISAVVCVLVPVVMRLHEVDVKIVQLLFPDVDLYGAPGLAANTVGHDGVIVHERFLAFACMSEQTEIQ